MGSGQGHALRTGTRGGCQSQRHLRPQQSSLPPEHCHLVSERIPGTARAGTKADTPTLPVGFLSPWGAEQGVSCSLTSRGAVEGGARLEQGLPGPPGPADQWSRLQQVPGVPRQSFRGFWQPARVARTRRD